MRQGAPEGGPSLCEVPELADGELALHAADGRHARGLGALMRDVEVQVLTGSVSSTAEAEALARGEAEPDLSPAQLRAVYDRWAGAEDRAVWAIEVDGAVVGEVLLLDLDAENRACGMRLWLARERDRGIGTRALRLVLDHAFGTVGLHRVGLEVYAHNPRAVHVYRKLGFVLEGTLREALLLDGRWVDCHVMGLLHHEWATARRA